MNLRALLAGLALGVAAFALALSGCMQGGGTDVGNPEIRGSIRHLDGTPAADIPLHLRPLTHLGSPDTTAVPSPAGGILQDGRTDTQGFFQFDSVPEGDYRIEAMDTNGRGAVIELRVDGTSPRVDLKPAFLDSTGSLSGQINWLGESAGGYPKITIAVYGMDRTTFATKSGAFVLSDLPPGKHRLHINITAKPEIQTEVAETLLGAGQNVNLGTVDLGP